MHYWCHPEIVCSHGVHELFIEYVCIIFKFRVYDDAENFNQGKTNRLEPVEDLTVEQTSKVDVSALKYIRKRVFPIWKKAGYPGLTFW